MKKSYVTRAGRLVEADEVFDAWTSQDLPRMLRAVAVRTNLIDRHFLLMGIVGLAYARRDDPAMRKTCLDVGRMHVAELPSMMAALVAEMGILPRVPTFARLATVLAEDGQFSEAIALCESAVRLGLRDGTKAGFPGRIRRLRMKAARERGPNG